MMTAWSLLPELVFVCIVVGVPAFIVFSDVVYAFVRDSWIRICDRIYIFFYRKWEQWADHRKKQKCMQYIAFLEQMYMQSRGEQVIYSIGGPKFRDGRPPLAYRNPILTSYRLLRRAGGLKFVNRRALRFIEWYLKVDLDKREHSMRAA